MVFRLFLEPHRASPQILLLTKCQHRPTLTHSPKDPILDLDIVDIMQMTYAPS